MGDPLTGPVDGRFNFFLVLFLLERDHGIIVRDGKDVATGLVPTIAAALDVVVVAVVVLTAIGFGDETTPLFPARFDE